jgi:hypothetical protein
MTANRTVAKMRRITEMGTLESGPIGFLEDRARRLELILEERDDVAGVPRKQPQICHRRADPSTQLKGRPGLQRGHAESVEAEGYFDGHDYRNGLAVGAHGWLEPPGLDGFQRFFF